MFTLKFYTPLASKLVVTSLEPGKLYKFNFFLENGLSTYHSTVYASTTFNEDLDVQLN